MATDEQAPDPPPGEDIPDVLSDPGTRADGENVVILSAEDFRLPDVLRHVEAGRVVFILPAPPRGT